MAYQVLARKWRPKQFEDVVGQSHVTRTLQNAIKQNKLAHAYLFTGTRGVGKTSIARLFAKAIRCETPKPDCNPCLVCASCKDVESGSSMDFTEIDGASNNSVDDVRGLIENVQYLPTRGKHKIYVIDEVHMLTVNAFNALLKTLEEPPAHAIFMLATTDPHKLLGTVISRCQRYDFKNVAVEVLISHLQKIATAEGIKFTSALVPKKIAELGKGSVRDSLSIFDQVLGLSGSNQVSEENVAQAVGLAGIGAMKELLSSILLGDQKKCGQVFQGLLQENVDLKKLSDQILDGMFRVINGIDEQAALLKEEVIQAGALEGITIAELFWIYETFAKDLTWSLESINPEKVVLINLQKLCLRRTILTGSDLQVQEVPQGQGKSAAEAHQPQALAKTWNGFLEYLRQASPATGSNLERGNLLQELDFSENPFTVMVGFPDEAAVFQEYLEDKDIFARLKNHLADFFEMDIEKIRFRTQLLSAKEREHKNFKTQVELADEERALEEEAKKKRILEDPYVQEAEKLFNSKIDKIILNK